MKSRLFLFGVGVFFATSAMAAKVGDTALYSGLINTNGQNFPVTLKMEVLSVAASGKFNVETTVSVSGQAQAQTSERSAAEIGDEAQAAQLVAECASKGGTPESITISTGEVLATCKVSALNNGVYTQSNIAAVPFLSAKLVQAKNDSTTTLELQSYVRGQ